MEYSYQILDSELGIILDLLSELNYSDYTKIISAEIDNTNFIADIDVEIDNNFINELDEDILKKYSEMYSEEEYFMRERIKQYILSLIENPDPLLPASVEEYIDLLNAENYDFCECLEIELEKTKGLIHFTEYEEYMGALEYINSKASKKYEVTVRYDAFASKQRNVLSAIEFKGTELKNKTETTNGTKYEFFMATIQEVK